MHLFLIAAQCSIALVAVAAPQSATASDVPQSGVILKKLYPPIYPAIAKTARVTGVVSVEFHVDQNGKLSSVGEINGPPLLTQAAIDSVRGSVFECQRCKDGLTSYSLTYTFSLRDDFDCGFTRVRSSRCLYLWKCGYKNNYSPRPLEIKQSLGHITVVDDARCVETNDSASAGK